MGAYAFISTTEKANQWGVQQAFLDCQPPSHDLDSY